MPRPKRINRHALYFPPRLAEKVKEVLTAPVTLVEAPSGFGKTTCIREALGLVLPDGAVPVYVECMEDLPSAAWRRFCQGIHAIDPATGAALQGLGALQGPQTEAAADLLHGLSCGGAEAWLVIDDFHNIAEAVPSEVWKALICHGSPGLHVIILAQSLGELGTYALGRPGVIYLDGDDLRLEKEEISRFFAKAGVTLTREEADEAYRWTEGWIAAAYLLRLHYIDHGRIVRVEGISRLIKKAFWNQLGSRERSLMLCLSLFESFTWRQAMEIQGGGLDSARIKALLDGNAFLHWESESLRMNTSLTIFLRREFALLPEDISRDYLYRAADWCSANGQDEKAFELYYRLREFEGLLSLFAKGRKAVPMSEAAVARVVKDIIHSCPRELKQKHPHAVLRLIFQLLGAGERSEFTALCHQMREEIGGGPYSQEVKAQLYGELEFLESFMYYNDIEQMGIRHRRANLLAGGDCGVIYSPADPWTLGIPSVLFAYHAQAGALESESELMSRHLPFYIRLSDGHGSGADALFDGEVYFCRGELSEAAICAHKADFQAEENRQDSVCTAASLLLGRLAIARGDAEGLEAVVSRLNGLSRDGPHRSLRMTADLALGFIMCELGKAEAIPGWLKQGDISGQTLFAAAIPFAQMVYFKLLLLEGRMEQLLGMADDAMALSRKWRYAAVEVYQRIYVAAAHHMLGRHDSAAEIMAIAVGMAAPDRLYAPFAENMGLVGTLLPKACPHDFLDAVTAFARQLTAGRNAVCQRMAQDSNPYGLTQREWDVVCLAARGLSNPEIAAELFISRNTVKSYMKTAYQKMGVSTRSELKREAAQLSGSEERHYAMER